MKDICANRHRGNPESERAYIDSLVGARKHAAFILERCAAGGATCREVAAALGVGMNVISGRFTELNAKGLIVKTGVRDRCAIYQAAS